MHRPVRPPKDNNNKFWGKQISTQKICNAALELYQFDSILLAYQHFPTNLNELRIFISNPINMGENHNIGIMQVEIERLLAQIMREDDLR